MLAALFGAGCCSVAHLLHTTATAMMKCFGLMQPNRGYMLCKAAVPTAAHHEALQRVRLHVLLIALRQPSLLAVSGHVESPHWGAPAWLLASPVAARSSASAAGRTAASGAACASSALPPAMMVAAPRGATGACCTLGVCSTPSTEAWPSMKPRASLLHSHQHTVAPGNHLTGAMPAAFCRVLLSSSDPSWGTPLGTACAEPGVRQ